ncbi:hypothetical protein [Sphingobium bisphenolivorans]|uniref:hypothetical protein n=1 Tax=Sphingobium bisphenolivorans TaxID=1335760 RepID=UPI0003AB02C8|nr:hypothetical protein [Sphingobium bisphenolivorans]
MIGSNATTCATCNKRFGSYHSMQQHAQAVHGEQREDFSFLNRYWHDPAFRAEAEAERVREQAKLNASIDAAQRRAWEARGMA